jgi:hypothetical protein
VGNLFSRVQPTGLDTKTTSAARFAAYDNTKVDPGLLAKNLDTIKADMTKQGYKLSGDDFSNIEKV